MVKRIGVTPGFMPGYICASLFAVSISKSRWFNAPNVVPHGTIPYTEEDFDFDWSAFWYAVRQGVVDIGSGNNHMSLIPITVGVFLASPITCLNLWMGSFFGAVFAVLFGTPMSVLAAGGTLAPMNASLVFANVNGNYFVLSIHSFILSVIAATMAVMGTNAWEVFWTYLGSSPQGYSAACIYIGIYASRHAFGRLLPVELASMTTPEDHLRRFLLTKEIAKKMSIGDISHALSKNMKLTPERQRNIQTCMLPILMCSYSQRDQRKMITELCSLQADVNLGDYDGRRALHLAACENQVQIVKTLLAHNAELNIEDNYGTTPLWDALTHEHWELAIYIHSMGGNMGDQKNRARKIATKLAFFVHHNKLKNLEAWLECGADPDWYDYDGRTALHVAESQSNAAAIKILKAHGADGKILDRWGTMSGDSKFNGRMQSISDVDADFANVFETTPIRTMALDKDLLVLSILSIADSNDHKRREALLPSLTCSVVCIRDVQLISQLIYKGVDVTMGDYDRRTPLHIACAIGAKDIVRKLVWNSANINAVDRFGYTPLYEAVQRGNDDVCEYLRSQGAELRVKDDELASLLCWGAFNNDIGSIRRLIENKADITVADYDGRRCLDVARDKGNKKLVEYIESVAPEAAALTENIVMDSLQVGDDDVFCTDDEDNKEDTDKAGFNDFVDNFLNESTPLLGKKNN